MVRFALIFAMACSSAEDDLDAVCANRCGEEPYLSVDGTWRAADCGPCDSLRPTVILEVDSTATDQPFLPVGSGFLGDARPGEPPEALVEPLRPLLWRWFRHLDHLPDRAEQFELGVGNTWANEYGWAGCTAPDNHPNDANPPCGEPWSEWCDPVAEYVLGEGLNPRWDLWSEPGTGPSGQFGQAEHLARALRACTDGLTAAYARAGRVDELTIVAPSMSSMERTVSFMFREGEPGCERMRELPWFQLYGCDPYDGTDGDFSFVAYLAEHPEMEIDVVSLHMFSDPLATRWDEHLAAFQEAMALDAAHHGVAVSSLEINEYLGPSWRVCAEPMGLSWDDPDCVDPIDEREWFLRPGHAVLAFDALQGAGVELAAKACWSDPTTELSGCNEVALDGLLVADGSFDTRPIWHVYRAYGSLDGLRVEPATLEAWHKDPLIYDEDADRDPFEALGAVAAVDGDTTRVLVGYSSAFYDPEVTSPSGQGYGFVQTPYREWEAVDAEVWLRGLDCEAVEVELTLVRGQDRVAALAEAERSSLELEVEGGAVRVEHALSKDDALLVEARCIGAIP